MNQSLACLALYCECTHEHDQWKALIMVRALDPAVVSVLWQAIYHHLPKHVDEHPLGCHRKRVPDLLCFRGILIRLVTGSSWETVEAIMEYKVSDTTLRARRDEWIAAGVFAELEAETRAGYDRIIGLDEGDSFGGPTGPLQRAHLKSPVPPHCNPRKNTTDGIGAPQRSTRVPSTADGAATRHETGVEPHS